MRIREGCAREFAGRVRGVKVASLVPSATEILFALGLGDEVVAVTHECDWPGEATRLPRLTRSVLPPGLEPAEIDSRVRELTGRGEAIYELDRERLAALEPDLIVTQAVCAVCAVSYDEVCSLAAGLPGEPAVLSLDPSTLDDVFGDVRQVAAACGRKQLGERLAKELARRVETVRSRTERAARPRVLALEWLDPPYIGGHWVPEMIAAAGGADALGEPGARSRTATWDELEASSPDVVVVMPCGLYADEAAAQARAHAEEIARLGAERIVAVDAASSFSRPGPRLADGVELLGHVLHPESVPAPEALAWVELGAGARAA